MTKLLFDLAGGDNRVTNLLPQQKLIAVAETVESLPERILRHSQFRSNLCARRRSRFVWQQLF